MLLSVIIPVFRDADALAQLLAQLAPVPPEVEVIVSTADDDEQPARIPSTALRAGRMARPDVVWIGAPRGRGAQLNAGAERATGRWLWFVHADSRLPEGWRAAFEALDAEEPPPVGGSFRFRLDSDAWQARVLERLVRARVRWLGLPYGDQGIFVRREVFQQMGGFQPIPLMEDVELVRRLTRRGPLRHQNLSLETSARRWVEEGWWRRSARNLATLTLYVVGVSPDRLAKRYYRNR
jgi:rSAM/selenodomain-associated transferase 2